MEKNFSYEQLEAARKEVSSWSLRNDILFSTVMDKYPKCMELLLNAILNRTDLNIVELKTQRSVTDLYAKGVRFDILCTDANDVLYNIEMQNDPSRATPKRCRFYSSSLDMIQLKQGQDYSSLINTYVIMLVGGDPLHSGKLVTNVYRAIEQKNYERYEDGTEIIYVNIDSPLDNAESLLAQIIHDLNCSNVNEMVQPLLRESTESVKSDRKECCEMKGTVQEIFAKGEARGNTINSWLYHNNRTEELLKSFDDSVLRAQLVAEYDAAHPESNKYNI